MFEEEADYITDYKKARKESKDKITKVISVWSAREETIHDEGFKDGAEFGYNKANEWHYVKDELPPVMKKYCGRSELVLVVSKEKEMQYAQYVEKEKTWARGILAINFEPYAWKEIVLPKEIKEND